MVTVDFHNITMNRCSACIRVCQMKLIAECAGAARCLTHYGRTAQPDAAVSARPVVRRAVGEFATRPTRQDRTRLLLAERRDSREKTRLMESQTAIRYRGDPTQPRRKTLQLRDQEITRSGVGVCRRVPCASLNSSFMRCQRVTVRAWRPGWANPQDGEDLVDNSGDLPPPEAEAGRTPMTAVLPGSGQYFRQIAGQRSEAYHFSLLYEAAIVNLVIRRHHEGARP